MMSPYIEKPQRSNINKQKKLPQLSFSVKLQDTKPAYRNQLCFYTLRMKHLKKKTSLFPIASETKYLVINLTKEMKDLYKENYKTLQKETQDTNALQFCKVWAPS